MRTMCRGSLLLTEVVGGEVGVDLAGECEGFVGGFGYDEGFCFREVPCGYAVAPPELTRDAPVADFGHPAVVGGLEFQVRSDDAVFGCFEGGCGEGFHAEEPLVAEAGFGCGVGGCVRVADFVFVVFDFFDESCFGEVFGYLFADGEAVHADVHSGGFADGGVVIEDVDCLQVAFFAEHVVVHVMGGCDFEAACAEVDLYAVVFDDGISRPTRVR